MDAVPSHRDVERPLVSAMSGVTAREYPNAIHLTEASSFGRTPTSHSSRLYLTTPRLLSNGLRGLHAEDPRKRKEGREAHSDLTSVLLESAGETLDGFPRVESAIVHAVQQHLVVTCWPGTPPPSTIGCDLPSKTIVVESARES